MRGFNYDEIHTGDDWKLILNSKTITPPEPKTYEVDIDGRDGTLDLSESLAGEIKFKDRTITAVYLLTEGSRVERERLIRTITNYLNGRKRKIVEPDDLDHYFIGRSKITAVSNNQAYGSITVQSTCDPWRYSKDKISRYCQVNTSTPKKWIFTNDGARTAVPVITVTGFITIVVGGVAHSLTAGSYRLTALKFRSGVNEVSMYGSGSATFQYEEADL